MEDKIKEAIALLEQNGYIVKKITKRMQEDSKECEQSDEEKDCCSCSCSICIMQ
jgi:hypothetical protein